MSLPIVASTFCLLLGAVIIFLGIAVLRDGARERLHRVTALMLFFGGLGAILAGLGIAVRATAPTNSALFTDVSLHFASVWEFFFPSLLLFTLVFPTEHKALKAFGGLQELIFIPYIFHLLLTLVADYSGGSFFIPQLTKLVPWASPLLTPARVGLSLLYDVHAVLFSLVNLGYVALTITILILRQRQVTNSRLKAQMRVMVWGLGSCLLLYSFVAPVPILLGRGARSLDRWTAPLLVLALALGSGAIAYSIIRHRFLDARLLVRRSLTFLAVAGVISTLYLLVVGRIEDFLGSFSGIDPKLIEPVFLMIALVMLQPAVTRAEEIMDRWMMRDRREGRLVLEQVSRDIVTLMDLPTMGARLTRAVFDSMVVEGVALLGRPGSGTTFELVACAGFPETPYDAWGRLADELRAIEADQHVVSVRELGLRGDSPAATRLATMAGEFPLQLLVPLHHGGDLMGALVMGPKVTRTRYTAEDLALLATLGNQTAAALRNTQLLKESVQRAALEEELHLARQIQVSYLPSKFPIYSDLELSGINVPSKQVGGDYYDYVDMGDSILVAVADVVGKGVPAALLMSMLQASLRTLAAEHRSLTEIIARLNRLILDSGMSGKFATLFLARLDLEDHVLHYSNAGHNPPCLVRADGSTHWLGEGGLLLGVQEDPRAAERSLRLEPGDRLVLYTDGVTEASNHRRDMFGEERLVSTLRGLPPDLDANAVAQRIMEAVRHFCGESEPGDDMTVVVVRVPQRAAVPV